MHVFMRSLQAPPPTLPCVPNCQWYQKAARISMWFLVSGSRYLFEWRRMLLLLTVVNGMMRADDKDVYVTYLVARVRLCMRDSSRVRVRGMRSGTRLIQRNSIHRHGWIACDC